MHTICDKKLLMLRPTEIRPSPNTIRDLSDDPSLSALAQSIAHIGLIEPIAIRKNERGLYELISGSRRLKAAKMAGLRRIPCILHSASITTAATYSLSANLHSCPLHFLEEAEAIYQLNILGLSHIEIALRLGVSHSFLNSRLKLLRLDSLLKEEIKKEGIDVKTALLMLKIPPERREAALNEIISENLCYEQSSRLIDEILSPAAEQKHTAQPPKSELKNLPSPTRKAAIYDLRIFSNSLEKLSDSMNNSGYDTKLLRRETDKYIDYKIRITKHTAHDDNYQLSLTM